MSIFLRYPYVVIFLIPLVIQHTFIIGYAKLFSTYTYMINKYTQTIEKLFPFKATEAVMTFLKPCSINDWSKSWYRLKLMQNFAYDSIAII
jgi:hypothetical protein